MYASNNIAHNNIYSYQQNLSHELLQIQLNCWCTQISTKQFIFNVEKKLCYSINVRTVVSSAPTTGEPGWSLRSVATACVVVSVVTALVCDDVMVVCSVSISALFSFVHMAVTFPLVCLIIIICFLIGSSFLLLCCLLPLSLEYEVFELNK